jgi:excisionase family DNA binding protein
MAQALAGSQTGAPTAPAGAVPPPIPASGSSLSELMSPADAAKALGVGEADVLAALSEGSLKGKKIGTAWRITKAALDDFLKS